MKFAWQFDRLRGRNRGDYIVDKVLASPLLEVTNIGVIVMPTVQKDRPIELKRKMSVETQKEIREDMNISQSELDELLTYKALIPSEDSNIMQSLQTAVLDVLSNAEPVLVDTGILSKSQIKPLRSKVLDTVCAVFLSASVYSDMHWDSLLASGKIIVRAKTKDDKVEANTPSVGW